MASDVSGSSLDALKGRRFSLYPAIRGIEHNEWTMRDSTWSEIRVRNSETEQELWIAKSHLGGVSSSDSPVLILGLRRELEFKAGGVFPYRRIITEMPSTPAGRHTPASAAPAPKQRIFSGSDARLMRLLLIAIGVGLLVSTVAFLGLVGQLHNPFDRWLQPDTSTTDQRYIGLGTSDSYFEVVARLEAPDSEQWISGEEDEIQFQALYYPSRRYIVILMGGARGDMRYLGTLHLPTRQVLDSARLSRGGDTGSMMRNLPGFELNH